MVDFLNVLTDPESEASPGPFLGLVFPTNSKYASEPINADLIFIGLLYEYSLLAWPVPSP